jgi:hypothetical protein
MWLRPDGGSHHFKTPARASVDAKSDPSSMRVIREIVVPKTGSGAA